LLSFEEFLRGSLHGHLWESCDHTYTTFYIDCATLNVFCFSFEGNERNRSVFSFYAKYESVDLLNHKYMMEPYLAGQHLNNYLRHIYHLAGQHLKMYLRHIFLSTTTSRKWSLTQVQSVLRQSGYWLFFFHFHLQCQNY